MKRKVEPERGEELKKLRGNHAWGGEGFAILTIMAHESIKMNGRVINISHAPH